MKIGDDTPARVCLTHLRVNICRAGAKTGDCEWSEDPVDVARVSAYQLRWLAYQQDTTVSALIAKFVTERLADEDLRDFQPPRRR
jgi:hypothetical protein